MLEEHIRKLEADRQTLTASYKSKGLEHSKLKSIDDSITKFRESSGKLQPVRSKDRNRGI